MRTRARWLTPEWDCNPAIPVVTHFQYTVRAAAGRRTAVAPDQSPDRRLAPVLRRDLHEEAVGIPEIDRRAACIGLIRISRFGVRQLAVDFVSEAFRTVLIHMVDCDTPR